MGNPLFNAIMGGSGTAKEQTKQNIGQAQNTAQNAPKMPKMNMQEAMRELQQHPAQLMKQAGFNVPDEIANNPQASVMHLIQSGQVGGPMMRRIQPMLNMLMGRR